MWPSGRGRNNAQVRKGLALAALALALSQQALAGDVPLPTRLASALAVRGNSPAMSAALAVDLQSDGVVFARHADLSLAPASNEKLPVTFAALRELGLSYRFKTEVLGRGAQEGTVWHGDLYLKGFGDPTLTSAQTRSARTRDRGHRDNARRRAGVRRRDVVRLEARRSRLESRVPRLRVPAALGARCRSRGVRRSRRVRDPQSPRSGRSAGCCAVSA